MSREEIEGRNQRLKAAIRDLDYAASPTRSFIVCDRDAAELRDDLTALLAENERLREALTTIRDWEPKPFALPEDWSEQIKACPKCQGYAGHPVQRGICDEHRRPLWDREKHDAHGERLRGWEAKSIARTALNKDPDQ